MTRNPWKLSTLALGAAFALTLAAPPADSAPQPLMKKALATLKYAKLQLKKADADKGGHRVKAMELVDQAIVEVQAGIDFDDKQPD